MFPCLTTTRRRWILVFAASGLSCYGAYRIYHFPSISAKRQKIFKLFSAIFSAAEAISSSADAVNLVSSDIKIFLHSDSDEIPRSLKQLAKIARSDEFSASISRVSDALAAGISRGLFSSTDSRAAETRTSSSFSDILLDKLLSDNGSQFTSVVIESFAQSLATAFCCRKEENIACDVPGWVNLMCSDWCRELVAGSIRVFVRTAVSVYLEKTMEVNAYEALFSGLTNPRHEAKVKDILVSVCNGAIETLVKTSHGLLCSSNSSSPSYIVNEVNEVYLSQTMMDYDDIKKKDYSRWIAQISSVLAVQSNRKLVLDVTGRVAFESVRSFVKFFLWNLQDGMKTTVNVVNEKAVERGVDLMRYLTTKAMFVFSLCIALCMGIAAGKRALMVA